MRPASSFPFQAQLLSPTFAVNTIVAMTRPVKERSVIAVVAAADNVNAIPAERPFIWQRKFETVTGAVLGETEIVKLREVGPPAPV